MENPITELLLFLTAQLDLAPAAIGWGIAATFIALMTQALKYIPQLKPVHPVKIHLGVQAVFWGAFAMFEYLGYGGNFRSAIELVTPLLQGLLNMAVTGIGAAAVYKVGNNLDAPLFSSRGQSYGDSEESEESALSDPVNPMQELLELIRSQNSKLDIQNERLEKVLEG